MSNIPPNNPPSNSSNEPNEPRRRSSLLSARDAAELAARVAELSAAGLPLAGGLRAASAELGDTRLARAMQTLAARLDRGQSLDAALADEQSRLPASVRGLMVAGVRSGRLGEALQQFVAFRQFVADMRRSVWSALAYPMLLLALFTGVFLFVMVELAPILTSLYEREPMWSDFSWPTPITVRQPVSIQLIFCLQKYLPIWLPAAIVVVAAMLLVWSFSGTAPVRRVLNRLPAVGPLWRLSGMAEFARLLRLLVDQGVPLPEALRLAADGINDGDTAAGARLLAERVESGQSLSAALDGLPQFASLERPLIAWGESHGAMAEGLDATVDLCVRRLRVWSEFFRTTLPLISMLAIAAGIVSLVSMFQLLISNTEAMFSFGPPEGVEVDVLPGALCVAVIGIALLISLRLIYASRRGGDALHLLLQILARVLLVYAVLGLCLAIGGFLGVLVWLAGLVVWGVIVFRRRRAKQQMLVDLLALATQRGLPLGPVAHLFAAEQSGVIGRRAEAFAERLDAGSPLADAILATPRLVAPQDRLAIEIGQQTESLPVTLQSMSGGPISPERQNESLGVGAISLVALATVGVGCVLFVAIKIVPAMEFIFTDLNRHWPGPHGAGRTPFHLPPLSQHLFSLLRAIGGPALPLVICCGAGLSFLALYGLAYAMGWVRAEIPLVNRFFLPRHTAVVLRWLAAAVRRQQPLSPVLFSIADRYPNRLIRRRVFLAGQDVKRGGNWIDGFRRRRLIGGTDSAILQAASRAGNLAWALDETSAALRRRLTYRLQAISQVLMPLAIIVAGGCVMLFIAGIFLPLVALITELAK